MITDLSYARVAGYLVVLAAISVQANNQLEPFITYSAQEMQQHKTHCIANINANPLNLQDAGYQMKRAISTIMGDDCDYIPKVVGAGELFNNGAMLYQLMHNGVKIACNCYYDVQWLTDVMHALKGHHEPQEEKCFYEVLKYIPEEATMIELGAYWGYYSLWFACQIAQARNYLIEPDPKRLEVGKKNFDLNDKTAFFRRGFVGVMKDDSDITDTEAISIDNFMEREKIEHVHILHADIQGAESEMLETTVMHLDAIDYFFISTHGLINHELCLQFFAQHKFVIVAEHTDLESCSGDGLIIAKRKGIAGPEHISIRKYPNYRGA